MDSSSSNPTKLEYYDDMWKLHSQSTLLSLHQAEDGRKTVILESTIFHPQGGGQPSDTGFITFPNSNSKFVVQDVRMKDGIVFHYGSLENENSNSNEELLISEMLRGIQVSLHVDEPRRTLNSRLHSAGHLLDVCVLNVGLTHLEPSKAYHFPDGPFVEYKGTIPGDLQTKQKELELEANALISRGGKISAAVVPYEEALKLCGGCLPDYIPKGSTPRIINIGDNPGCPCGGTHVHDISEIISMKSQIMRGGTMNNPDGEIKVSFGYQCNGKTGSLYEVIDGCDILLGNNLRKSSSFACLSGAAISANATLANTNICNGVIGAEILPSWDSPKSFRRIPSSPSVSKLDILSSSIQSNLSNLSCSSSTQSDTPESDSYLFKSMSAPSRSEGFLNAMKLQVAGGAAGEDRVQAVCSEENGWLFCAIYDGFNGRDAADFLAGTLYETIVFNINSLEWEPKENAIRTSECLGPYGSLQYVLEDSNSRHSNGVLIVDSPTKVKFRSDSFNSGVLEGLQRAVSQAENDFLYMVEHEMEDRPDLVSVGSCVLVVLLYGQDLYTLSLGDSRAVLATYSENFETNGSEGLKAVQLTDSHTVDNEVERTRLLNNHHDDPTVVVGGKVKGKLKVTRALGVGYLKKKKLNDALMGILRVRNLVSPPYISTEPSLNVHTISKTDHFVIVGSDGLFDFFTNDEAVKLVHSYILANPAGDPAKFLVDQVVLRAADCAGFSREELISIPAGRRRKYHDDVTVIVIILGTDHRTSKASTYL